MHWLRRSPAKMKSISFISSSAFLSAFQQASSCILLSAFSQVFSPKRESSSIISKSFPRGPSPSFFEPTAAEALIPTSPSMIIVCFPILCAKKSPRFKGSFCGKILNMQKNKRNRFLFRFLFYMYANIFPLLSFIIPFFLKEPFTYSK